MKALNKSLIIGNLIVLLIYTALLFSQGGLTGMLGSAMLIAVQVSLNIIAAIYCFIKKDRQLGKSFLLSAGLVLLIGFSTCWGGVMIDGKLGPQ